MKNIVFVALAFALSTVSAQATMPEAPWADSQDVFKQVLKYLNDQMLPVVSIQFTGPEHNSVLSQVSCGNGKQAALTFRVERDCRPTQIPGMCIPTRIVQLDLSKSETCN